MRSTIVPAQITTVEDRIAGKLSLSQLLLLVSPIFGGSAVFVVLPPFFNYAVYKVVLIVCVAVISALLAIRIKGKILLFWGITLLHYNTRPKYYLFNKNSAHAREISITAAIDNTPQPETKTQKDVVKHLMHLSATERARIESLIADPAANVHFTTTKKGELRVHLTEVPQEGLSAATN